MNFSSLGLAADIVRAVTEHGYTQPTPIQLSAIPAVLEGRDLLAGAQTGTGKTAGFVLPILHQLCQKIAADAPGQRRKVRVLILTPTRELAAQVEESVRVYGKYTPVKSTVVFGGVGMQPQVTRLAQTLDVLVATPGRLLDHIQQRTLRLDTVETLVLDEADRMLDMGFIHDVKRILALLPKKRQNLLFSATFSDDIRELADRLLDRPAEVEVARRNAPAELVEQCVYRVRKEAKRHLLARLIKAGDWHQVLVFTRTKHGANRLAEQLSKGGIPSLAIHGNKSQTARTRALAEFKSNQIQVLVATDIAARGIDIKELPHVVNYDLPNVPEDYVHRIGRTGRASMSGEAISLVGDDETGMLAGIERLIKRKLPRIELSAEDQAALDSVVRSAGPDLDPRPERPPHRGGRGAGSGNARNRGSNHSRSGNGNGDANGNRMSSRGTQQRFR
ncbi:MAG: DEAD/DEAH box helicase [Pseudomonadales bacterium]|jgi:ATP-dependent RNA helicase RhlE|nr:DEAD/DEAH box helicase [Gammaproteobacteria bacterium]MBK8306179.1 DEAD/DEAH box helicase [Gammaproteobacteria bacterium]MBK9666981.1 DEAD/DEAH box helicase [Gammaproteobacteria bacterium]MBP6053424.1 DEAD/DEAH box helicase [Pseudomonadales bacterium]MBP6228364.1 DEAD/DEAH box helicase [Pseudomonadales bacterium]